MSEKGLGRVFRVLQIGGDGSASGSPAGLSAGFAAGTSNGHSRENAQALSKPIHSPLLQNKTKYSQYNSSFIRVVFVLLSLIRIQGGNDYSPLGTLCLVGGYAKISQNLGIASWKTMRIGVSMHAKSGTNCRRDGRHVETPMARRATYSENFYCEPAGDERGIRLIMKA